MPHYLDTIADSQVLDSVPYLLVQCELSRGLRRHDQKGLASRALVASRGLTDLMPDVVLLTAASCCLYPLEAP